MAATLRAVGLANSTFTSSRYITELQISNCAKFDDIKINCPHPTLRNLNARCMVAFQYADNEANAREHREQDRIL